VKVLDFGLAKALTSDPNGAEAGQSPTISMTGTRAGMILGTAAYMSPEQARGQTVDHRADIWAFGCVLYELLTGSLAFPGSTASDIIASILTREPDWSRLPQGTPEPVRRALRRCLARDIRRRLRHAADVRLELDDAAQAVVAGGRETLEPGERRPPWRSMLLVALAASALTAVLLYVVYLATVQRGIDPAAATADTFASQVTDHGGSERDAAIAPDGRSFVFVSAHDGTPDLWLRQVSGEIRYALLLTMRRRHTRYSLTTATRSISRESTTVSLRCGGSRRAADLRGKWWSGAACQCRRRMESRWLTSRGRRRPT
jgi:hypothetical protein